MKTSTGLVSYAKAQLGLPYWYGTYGQTASLALLSSKRRQYPDMYMPSRVAKAASKDIGKRVHDCSGIVKGYLWSDNCTASPVYKGSQDLSANTLRSKCVVCGDITSIPEVPGVLVFMDKHVGVYIGSGEVIEARGFEYGVVKTKLKSRPWTSWGCCPFISYDTTDASPKSNNSSDILKENYVVLKPGTWWVRSSKDISSTTNKITTVSGGRRYLSSKLSGDKKFYYLSSTKGWVSAGAISSVTAKG